MRTKWTKEQAWEWYNSRPWIRGYNGFPSNAVNLIALWQSYNHEEIFAQQEREFALARETGFNATRIQVNLAVWILEHDCFMNNLEEYLSLAAKYGQKVMLIFGGDSLTPKNKWEPPKLGEQKVDWGWHGGHKDGQFAYVHEGKGYSLLDEDEEYRENFFRMIDEISARYANDPRVQVWDIWNEIGGGGRGTASVPYMERAFEILWKNEVTQPITAGCFTWNAYDHTDSEAEKRAMELSDVVSFHCYQPYEQTIAIVETLKETYGRPLLCTEWLHRIGNNNVREIFPLFYLENVGCYCWGLVQGFYQSYEPHGVFWPIMADPNYEGDLNLTAWQHDLYHFNGTPYIAKEIACIKRFAARADKKFGK